jgi:hypothetical protein
MTKPHSPQINDGMDVLVMLQRIRRAFPRLTSEMDLLVDLVSDGDVSLALDAAIAKERAR